MAPTEKATGSSWLKPVPLLLHAFSCPLCAISHKKSKKQEKKPVLYAGGAGHVRRRVRSTGLRHAGRGGIVSLVDARPGDRRAAVVWPQGLSGGTNWFALGLGVAAFIALYRIKLDMLWVILGGGLIGLVYSAIIGA